jgi:S1-C subfamily serine protease
VTIGDSSSATIGEDVVAIGNALGQGGAPTVTVGTITATGRDITVGNDQGGQEHLHGLLQTDASISPGDSGGPIVDASGQVLGMITASARVDLRQPASNVGYAIPTNAALRLVNRIRTGRGGSSIIIGQPGYLGVQVRTLDRPTAAHLGLSVSSGALVVAVIPGMPAAGVGMAQGAVITMVNGKRITSADTLGPALHVHQPGDQVRVTWVDASGTHTATVSLVSGPAV